MPPEAWFCGIECDTLSSLNSKSKVGEAVCETGTGKTGSTAVYCIKYIQRCRPCFVMLENVPPLSSAGRGSVKQSDLDILVGKLNDLGYVAIYKLLDASEYGAPQMRERWYILAFLQSVGPSRYCQSLKDFDNTLLPHWWHVAAGLLKDRRAAEWGGGGRA